MDRQDGMADKYERQTTKRSTKEAQSLNCGLLASYCFLLLNSQYI